MSATKPLSDAALAHLRVVVDEPDLRGTRYELCEPIGRGGMGAVWRALDRQLERDVALKVLAEPDPVAARDLARRLEQEAKVLARLEHPGIVPVHDVGLLADGRAFYAMKLVRGRRLVELLRAGLPEEERFRIFTRLCEAVAFAHSRGVVHRDLKPANVMVGEFGEVLVLDWGLASVRDADPAAKPETLRVGTPGFMAPEQERGATEIDARADVFALGRILEELALAGRPLAAIVAKATSEDRDDRYPGVVELAQDVDRFRAGESVSALPEGPLVKLARFHRRYKVALWLVIAYVVARLAFEWVRRFGAGP